MGETDITFRRLLRALPQPILQLAFPGRQIEPFILGSEAARRIFHMESLIQDPSVQELVTEWEDKGRAKGLMEGRAEGRATGRVEGIREALYRVLSVRAFGVTPDIRARIDREHDPARLESWLEAAVTARSFGDVFRDG